MNKLVRKIFQGYEPYQSSFEPYDIVLNANENPRNMLLELPKEELAALFSLDYNRYPEGANLQLRKAYASFLGEGYTYENILAGNGSDEIIRMLSDVFLENGEWAVACEPTFSMYRYSAELAKGRYFGIAPKDETLRPDVEGLIAAANEKHAKLVYLCTPNNPTGYQWPQEDVRQVIARTEGIVVLDEAYVEFSGDSLTSLALENKRVVALRTLSKAFGLAGARVGFAVGQKETIDALSLAKAAYNVNDFSQAAGALVLSHPERMREQAARLTAEREYVEERLAELEGLRVYPSCTNFLLVKTPKAGRIMEICRERGILLRDYGGEYQNFLRLSMGEREENEKVIQIFREVHK